MALSFTIRDIYYQTSIELLAKDDVKHKFNITISAEEAQQLKELDIVNKELDLQTLLEKLDKMHKIFFKDDLDTLKEILVGENFDDFFEELVLDYVNFIKGEKMKQRQKYQNTKSQAHQKR